MVYAFYPDVSIPPLFRSIHLRFRIPSISSPILFCSMPPPFRYVPFPLNSRSTTLNRGRGRARSPATLLARRDGIRPAKITGVVLVRGRVAWRPGLGTRPGKATGVRPIRNLQWCYHIW
jgi:hypothetical protein